MAGVQKCCRNIAENFNRLSRAHERYRQTTDGRTITKYSECERVYIFLNLVYIKTIYLVAVFAFIRCDTL